MSAEFEAALASFLDDWPCRRVLRDSVPLPGGRVQIGDRAVHDFSSNDYLGLAHHPGLAEAAGQWTRRYASGATASRLITGNHPGLAKIESRLATLKQTATALVFPTGFQANSTVLAALLDPRVHGRQAGRPAVQVFSDRLIHASLHFGLAAAGVRQHRFAHNDLNHLERLLQRSATEPVNRLIVVESVYSMEGDVADIDRLQQLAARYSALLYVDDAHAFGVLGPQGRGLAAVGAGTADTVISGTFGKAAGSLGAWVAGSEVLREFLVNRCAGLIYSTGLPPGVLGTIDAALERLPDLSAERRSVLQQAERFRQVLAAAGLDTGNSSTHIVPVISGDPGTTVRLADQLLEAGYLTAAIRPPTVPPGQSRLRVSFSAAHSAEQVDGLARALLRIMPCRMLAHES